jgi:uncharacterized protein
MELGGKCRILKIYISEESKYKRHSLYHALTLKFKEMGLAGVTVTRGIEGFGQGNRLSSVSMLDISFNLPVIVEAVDKPEKIEAAAQAAKEMVGEGLIMIADVEVVKYGGGKVL